MGGGEGERKGTEERDDKGGRGEEGSGERRRRNKEMRMRRRKNCWILMKINDFEKKGVENVSNCSFSNNNIPKETKKEKQHLNKNFHFLSIHLFTHIFAHSLIHSPISSPPAFCERKYSQLENVQRQKCNSCLPRRTRYKQKAIAQG